MSHLEYDEDLKPYRTEGLYFRHKRVLCVFAHPDDEVLGCGGTLARFREEVADITFAWMAFNNAIGAETDVALSTLGYYPVPNWRHCYPDNRMDGVAQADINAMAEQMIAASTPDIIFTHHYGDTNVDHRRTHEAVVVATRAIGDTRIDVLTCEVLSSTGYLRPCGFEPTIYVKLRDEDLNAKCKAMSAYRSQVRLSPHPRSTPVIRSLAHLRGSESGWRQAEGFMLHRMYI